MPYRQPDPFAMLGPGLTMDRRSPWFQMMLQQGEVAPPGTGGNPPPFIPVPVPVPTTKPRPTMSTTTVEPGIKGEEGMLKFLDKLDKKSRRGWREDLKQNKD